MPYTKIKVDLSRFDNQIEEDEPGLASDIAYGITSAANKGLASMARAADTVFSDGVDGDFINRLEANAEYGQENLSEAQKISNQKEFVTEDDEGYGFGDAWSDPRAYSGIISSAIGSQIPMMGAGGALGSALKYGLAKAGAAKLAQSVAGATAFGAAETAMVTGGVAGEIQAGVQAMPDEMLADLPKFQDNFYKKLDSGLDEKTAWQESKDELGRELGIQGMKDVAIPSFLLGTAAGTFLDKFLTGKLTGSVGSKFAKGAGTEGLTEGAQGGYEHYTTQNQLSKVDPSIDPSVGSLNAAVMEGLGGIGVGGGLGAISRTGVQPDTTKDDGTETTETSIDESQRKEPVKQEELIKENNETDTIANTQLSDELKKNGFVTNVEATEEVKNGSAIETTDDAGNKITVPAKQEVKQPAIDDGRTDGATSPGIDEVSIKDGVVSEAASGLSDQQRKINLGKEIKNDKNILPASISTSTEATAISPEQKPVTRQDDEQLNKNVTEIQDGINEQAIVETKKQEKVQAKTEKAKRFVRPKIISQKKDVWIEAQYKKYIKTHKHATQSVKDKEKSRLNNDYKSELDKAYASIPFDKFHRLNKGFSEEVNRQSYDALREEYFPGEPTIDKLPLNKEYKKDNEQTEYKTTNERTDPDGVQPAARESKDVKQVLEGPGEVQGVDDNAPEVIDHSKGKYHPAIGSLSRDLVSGGGISVDKDGKRNQSLNPDWFVDNAFVVLSSDGKRQFTTTPTVKAIQQAVSDHEAGKVLKNSQKRILEALSDIATAEEEFSNEQFNNEQIVFARDLNALIISGQETNINEFLKQAAIEGRIENYDDIAAWQEDIKYAKQEASKKSSGQPNEDTLLSEYTEEEIKEREQQQADIKKKDLAEESKAKNNKGQDDLVDEFLGKGQSDDIFADQGIKVEAAERINKKEPIPDKKSINIETAKKAVKKSKTVDHQIAELISDREKLARMVNRAGGELEDYIFVGEEVVKKDTESQNIKPKKTTNNNEISDFGETITGARKMLDIYTNKMDAAKSTDAKTVPFSKSWPEPDYNKLIENGVDKWVVSLIRVARDAMPIKPRKTWKLKGWEKQLVDARGFADDMLTGVISKDDLLKSFNKDKAIGSSLDIQNKIALYEAVGHDKTLKDVTLKHANYALYKGEENVSFWVIEKPAKGTLFSNFPAEISKGDTKEEAIANFKKAYDSGAVDAKPKSKDTKFDVYYNRGDTSIVYIGKKVGRNYIELESFPDVKQAREYLNNNQDKLEAKLEKAKFIPNKRKESNEDRVGKDYRDNGDVKESQFKEAFGFRGVQFGETIIKKQDEAQDKLNETYDALLDLSEIIGIPSEALSLNGDLALALGARGKGGKNAPSAHYEPNDKVTKGTVVINLTRRTGAGSLGHEWWHSLDNYFTRLRGEKGGDNYLSEKAYERGDGVRPEMVTAFKEIVAAIKKTGLPKRSAILDKKRSKPYWNTVRELTARAFESYLISKVKDTNSSNDYLVNIVDEKVWKASEALGMELDNTYPYIESAEIPEVRAAFDNFFKVIQTKKTDKGTALFSKGKQASGLTINDVNNKLPRRNKRMVKRGDIKIVQTTNELSKEIGRTSESLQGIEGAYNNGIVYLVADNLNEDTVIPTLNHELFHNYLDKNQTVKAKLLGHKGNVYDAFSDLFDRGYNRKYRPIMAAAMDRVNAAGTKSEDRIEELAAYMVTEWSVNPEGLLPKLRKAIADLVAYIKTIAFRAGIDVGKLTPADLTALARSGYGNNKVTDGKKAITMASKTGYKGTDVEEAKEWTEALRSKVMNNGMPLFSYSGKKSKLDNKGKLSDAVQMEKDGVNSNQIRKDTGWFLNEMDNKWRYEINDKAMKVKDAGIEGVKYNETVTLSKVISHSELFKAYPSLRDIKIRKTTEKGVNGIHDGDTIFIQRRFLNYDDITKEILVHEIQHAIQNIEGFASGGSPSDFKVNQDENYNKLAGEIEARDSAERSNLTGRQRKDKIPYLSQGIKKEDAIVLFNDDDPKFSKKGANTTWRDEKGFEGLDEETLAATGKIGVPPSQDLMKEAKDQFDKHTYLWRNKLKQGIFDQYDSFKSLLKDKRAWMMANISNSGGAVTESAIEYGLPFLDKSGAIDIKENSKSLGQIFEPLGEEIDRFLMWIGANRAKNLKLDGKENLFNDNELDKLTSLNKNNNGKEWAEREKVYEEVRKDFERMHNAFVKIGVDTGLVSKEDAALWADQGFYVPFYRLAEDSKDAYGQSSIGGLVKQQAYKKLKGADMQLNDLLSNTLMNWNHLVNASLKNQAANSALESAVDLGYAKEINKKEKGDNSVFIRDNGQERWFDIQDSQEGQLVLDSLTSLNWNGLNNPAMKVMRKFKRALTIGVTASPEFKIANLIRDSMQAIAVSDMSTNIAKNLQQGFKYSQEGSPTKARMVAGGGAFGDSGYIHGADPDAIKTVLKKGMDRASILDTRGKFKKVWDAYQDFGARLENVNRMANFEQAIEQGKDLLTANFEARDQLDFQRTGSFVTVRALSQVIPFLNARLQGMNKLGRAAMDPKQRKQFSAVIGKYAVLSMALYLSMKDDDDYKKAEQWERDTYHLFKVPGSDKMYRLPRPFELGSIVNMIERGLEQMVDDKVHGKLFAERLGFALSQTMAIDIVPQALKPANEIWANKSSFTGRDIESLSLQRLSKTERKKAWTSQTAIGLSKAMDTILWDDVVLSPVQIEHLVNGYLGWAGATVLGGIDQIARPISGATKQPAMRIEDYPVIGRFVREGKGRNSRFVTEFYNQQREISQNIADIKRYRDNHEMDKYKTAVKEYRGSLVNKRYVNAVGRKISNINKQIRLITANKKLSSKIKRKKIDILNNRKINLARRAVERMG